MFLPLFALLLGAFAIGTTELVVAGILPEIAADLGVSIATAGLLVTGYAVAVAIGGPAMMSVASRWPGKPGILGVLTIFLVAHLLCAAAAGFGSLMAARVLAAAAHGCFFGFAIALATGSAPPQRRAMALSIVVAGINVANVVGVPMGTAIGAAYGWRATFAMVAGLTLVALAATALLVPPAPARPARPPLRGQAAALLNARVLVAYGLIVLQMTAFFSLVTFIAPYLAEVAGIGQARLPAVLLALGVAGVAGSLAGGWLTDRSPGLALVAGFAIATAGMATLWRATPSAPMLGVAGLMVVGALGSVSALAAQHRILAGAREAPELASTLMSSVFNVGIATGAGLGAWAVAAGVPYRHLPLIGVLALGAATLVALAALRADRRRPS